MKAIVSTKSGPPDVLQLQEVEKPVAGPGEILIKVHAATVTRGDVMLRTLPFFMWPVMRLMGIRRKKTPGHEFAGEVEAVGKAVSRFKPGDQVFGTTTGLRVGANAEYIALPEVRKSGLLDLKPANASYEEAAALPVGGMTALYLLQKANIRPGQNVLIYGASGSVGTYAVQLARSFGAEVTGVCSTANVEMVKSLGAAHVIDYTNEDFTALGQRYDIIFDAVGKITASDCEGIRAADSAFVSIRTTTHESAGSLEFLRKLVEAGEIKPVIDRCYPLEETADAHRYVETGRKKGNVVITVDHGPPNEEKAA